MRGLLLYPSMNPPRGPLLRLTSKLRPFLEPRWYVRLVGSCPTLSFRRAFEPMQSAHRLPSGTKGWPNCGKTTKHEDGRVHIRLQAPQPCQEEGSLWPRHVHFMRSTDESSVDPSSVFTVGAWPSHHEEDYKCHCVSECGSCSIVTPEIVRNVLQGESTKKVLAHQCDGRRTNLCSRAGISSRCPTKAPTTRSATPSRCGHVSRGRVLCQTGVHRGLTTDSQTGRTRVVLEPVLHAGWVHGIFYRVKTKSYGSVEHHVSRSGCGRCCVGWRSGGNGGRSGEN